MKTGMAQKTPKTGKKNKEHKSAVRLGASGENDGSV